jgi:hypothetical protein
MNCLRSMLAAVSVALVVGAAAPVFASQDYPKAPTPTPNLSGLHNFDFFFGNWRAHHRKLTDRLVGSHNWIEFDGTISVRPLMNGWANVDENIFVIPNGGTYRGVTLRSYDGVTGMWNIWWLDGRSPSAALDPAVKGRFANGIGLFYADDTLRGKPVKVRFTWSHISATTARWEQAFSGDGGKTWETNWVTDFTKIGS